MGMWYTMCMTTKDLTPARYIGKVCEKHLEFAGLRMKSNRKCVECLSKSGNRNERTKKFRDTHKVQAADIIKAWKVANPGIAVAHSAKRRAAKLERTPAWADLEKIKEIYRLAAELGMVVDHVVPLQGELVSGLHVHINLQLITAFENGSKGNKFHG